MVRQFLRHMYEAGSLIKDLQAILDVCFDAGRNMYGMLLNKPVYMQRSPCVRNRTISVNSYMIGFIFSLAL
jgi:uncharacterized protein YrrD